MLGCRLFVVITFPTWCCLAWTSKYISKDFEKSSAAAYGKVVDPRAEISSVAVFLLGTMYGAKEYGADTNEHAFYERAVAARATWAKHAKVFYIVTGKGGSEDKALKQSTRCRDTTKHFRDFLGRHHVQPQSFEVFHCGEPALGMNVLHLPHCEGSYWGPKGPCCRCEAAALFYLALHSHHRINHNTTAFPNWFLFADDDFYVRLNYLEAMLTKPQFPADHPYAVTSSCNFDSYQTTVNGSSVKTEVGVPILRVAMLFCCPDGSSLSSLSLPFPPPPPGSVKITVFFGTVVATAPSRACIGPRYEKPPNVLLSFPPSLPPSFPPSLPPPSLSPSPSLPLSVSPLSLLSPSHPPVARPSCAPSP